MPGHPAQVRLGITTIRTIYASAVSAEAMTQAQNDITPALRASHGLLSSEEDDFQVISLVVGGIGIRKAIGAKRGVIMRQFLIEAVILSLMGGTAGVLLGLGTAKLLEKVANLSIELTLEPTLYSFLSSMAVGIIFGVYPARKAAQLKPIDALRYE
ncbi:ABC transporter permease [Paenibacillus sp. FSL P4-0127]|uniref:ABC transporter permease n=1 Tax=unclassified Paenibacillus TaxID=185978 RepID=UPI004040C47C